MKLCPKCKKNKLESKIKFYRCKECNLKDVFECLNNIALHYAPCHVAFNGNLAKYHKQKVKKPIYK